MWNKEDLGLGNCLQTLLSIVDSQHSAALKVFNTYLSQVIGNLSQSQHQLLFDNMQQEVH